MTDRPYKMGDWVIWTHPVTKEKMRGQVLIPEAFNRPDHITVVFGKDDGRVVHIWEVVHCPQ